MGKGRVTIPQAARSRKFAISSLDNAAIVVGGGPAGATAARALALAGIPVQLLDRASFPRNKPCGGGITVRVFKRFPYLAGPINRIATHYVSRLHLEGPDGSAALIESDVPPVLLVRRLEFDALLVSLAADAGAEIVSGVDVVGAREHDGRVTLTSRDGRSFAAPVVVAADGVHSVVARRLGLNTGWPATAVALDMMEETPREQLHDVDPSTLWVAYGYGPNGAASADATVPKGYAYIFPKRDHVNIGIGYVLAHYRSAVGDRPYDLQRGFVDHLRRRGIVRGESVRANFTPFIIPVGGPLRRPGRGRVLLAGDAGGFVNGFTAEGIYYAMVSGDLAARAIVESGSDIGGLAHRFRRLCNYEIGAELSNSVTLQRLLFASAARISSIIDGARHESTITRLVLDLAIGRRSYRNVRRQIMWNAPGFGAQFIWQRLVNRA